MNSRQVIAVYALAGTMMLILPCAAPGQQPNPPKNITPGVPINQPSTFPSIISPPVDLPVDLAERQAKLVNAARQKQLVLDTQRLLTLANDLKAAVDKSNKDTLSLDVIRKADEIEKLAHSVKEKMKGS